MASQREKLSVKITPGAVVCNECELIGDISIGTKTVIHPKARIIAEGGPIVIGEGNLIEEQVQIIYRKTSDHKSTSDAPVMTIGNYNVFEVASTCESLYIGDNNVLEAKSKLGPSTRLTNGCIVGAMCELSSPETIPENTVVYGQKCERRIQAERPTVGASLHYMVYFLRCLATATKRVYLYTDCETVHVMAGNSNKKGSKSSKAAAKVPFLESPSTDSFTQEKPSTSTSERSAGANKRRKSLYNSRCKPGGDILNPTAIQNAYYICHNVQDCLFFRGFKWPAESKGKKSGKK